MSQDIAARFARETAEHQMTVLHDDGLYRHLRFRPAERSFYWFDLITVPGTLIFQGDGRSFVFSRVRDMFEFFRGPVGRINPQYWAEKLTSSDADVMKYDRDVFEARVTEAVADAIRYSDAPEGLAKAVREEVLGSGDIDFEETARQVLESFEYCDDDVDRLGSRMRRVDGVMTYVERKRPDFQFTDVWEMNFRDYDWWFLWALHGIVWGIASYDAGKPVPFEVPQARAVVAKQPPVTSPASPRVETVRAAGGVL